MRMHQPENDAALEELKASTIAVFELVKANMVAAIDGAIEGIRKGDLTADEIEQLGRNLKVAASAPSLTLDKTRLAKA